jgi:hypothetical protein
VVEVVQLGLEPGAQGQVKFIKGAQLVESPSTGLWQ